MRKTLPENWTRAATAAMLTALAYYLLARLGLSMALAGTNSSPIWPAAGLALAAAMRLGTAGTAGIFLGSLTANLQLLSGRPDASVAAAAFAALAAASGSTIQAEAGARLLSRLLAGRDPLGRGRDAAVFAVAIPLVCLVAASVGPAGMAAAGLLAWSAYPSAWFAWWTGDVTGVVIFTPLLLALNARNALERRVSEQTNDLWNADVALRVAAIGRKEDEKRVLLYRRIVDELPAGIVVLQLDTPGDVRSWRIVEMNPAGQRLTGAESDPAVGRRLLDFAPEVFLSDLPQACARCLESGRSEVISDFLSSERVPGAHFSIKVFPLDERQVGIVFENVTAEWQARAALARSNAELTQFAYVASHDLQEPLRKAEAFAEQLDLRLAGSLDDVSRDFLVRLRRSLTGMQDLIEALLQLARVATQAGTPVDVDLTATAEAALEELAHAIERSGGRVAVSALPRVNADPRQMRQLLVNLVSNALKFRRKDAPPSVRVYGRSLDDGSSVLCVEDDGAGFDMQYAGRLFQPFQRLHSRNEYPGTGMGLAICQKIVERHGGTISAQGNVGRGALFRVVLPSSRRPATAAVPAGEALN